MTDEISSADERTLAVDLRGVREGDPVVVQGWLHRRRELSNVAFLSLRDRTGLAQVVVRSSEPLFEEISDMREETVYEVRGVASVNDSAPGGVEIVQPTFLPLSEPAKAPPVELWRPKLTSVSRSSSITHPSCGATRSSAPGGSWLRRQCSDSGPH